MQSDKNIQDILKKFVLNKCNKEEVEEVIAYFQSITDYTQVPSVEDVLMLLEEKPEMSIEDADRIHNNILEITKKQKKRSTRYFWRYAAAAVVIGVLATSHFISDTFSKGDGDLTPVITNDAIVVGTDKATLTLDDGTQVALEKGKDYKVQNAKSNGSKIVYKENDSNLKEVVYNTLTIPRGGQFHIVLSDGTEVWLNSDTQIKYPVTFIKNESRRVELLYGEAYFDVSPSSKHEGSNFKVLNKEQEVVVLGTEFNIKAYNDETDIYTTLVEGKVNVSIEENEQVLAPGEQLFLDKLTNSFVVREVDVYNEISWKDGIFSFDDKSLEEVMIVLSRWYDVEFEFKSNTIKEAKFIGILRKNQNIEEILLGIKNLGFIEDYEIYEKKIILN